MKVFVDTSIIVDVDRGRRAVIETCKKLTRDHNALVSTVTVSEILTGSYLRKDYAKAAAKARKILGQFTWISIDGAVAEKVAQLNAYLMTQGQPIEYQDNAIAASCLVSESDFLLTNNEEHFSRIPALRAKILTPVDIMKKLER